MSNMSERLIKSKKRVQKHGEVFTPNWMVEQILNNNEIKKSYENLTTTFLEPAAGEGNFLIAILKRKLEMVEKLYSNTIIQFENFSLYALSTIYGIELLEDNVQICVTNLFKVYYDFYIKIAQKLNKKIKKKILDSAKVIIKANIVQGDFLTHKNKDNVPIIFSEWNVTNKLTSKTKTISVLRTEYTFDEILQGKENKLGNISEFTIKYEQKYFPRYFRINNESDVECTDVNLSYLKVKITDIYKEELSVDNNE